MPGGAELRLYAHRGAAAEQPENTVPSFQLALELGANALEMDVHMTSDGVLVVSHDPDGDRMCGVPAMIRHCPLVDVGSWDAGRGFLDEEGGRPFADRGITMPTLEQVLVEFPDIPINVDLKQPDPPIADAFLSLVRRLGDEHRVMAASFHLTTLLSLRRRGYAGPTAMSPAEGAMFLALPAALYRRLPLRATAAQVPPRAGVLRFDTGFVVNKARAAGVRLDFWTINDPAEAERLYALGAHGVMTDDPRAIAPVFERLVAG